MTLVCTDPAELDAWIEDNIQPGQMVGATTRHWARARLAEGKRLEWGVIRPPGGVDQTTILALPATGTQA